MKTGRFLTLLLALIITTAMVFAIPAVVSSAAEGYVMEVHHNGAPEATLYEDFEDGWNAAMGNNNRESTTTVKLLADWTAVDGNFGTGTGFDMGVLYVTRIIALDLNGHTIDRGLSSVIQNGSVIFNYGTLTITDSSATRSGKITGGNTSGYGGGICNYNTFTLSGGEISGNIAGISGGGVSNENGRTFNMTGGKISGNNASYGGGVTNAGVFNISSGEISGNDAEGNGGGVFINPNKTFNVSGTPVIKDNFTGGTKPEGSDVFSNGKNNNVYLSNGCYINISDGNAETLDDSLSDGAEIWVTTQTAPTEGTSVSITNADDADNSGYFHSDNDAYSVINTGSGNEQVVTLGLPVMSVDYDGEGSGEPVYFADFVTGWKAAVSDNTLNTVVTLLMKWTAVDGSFGSGDGFENGAILVPEGKTITLDLNGYDIDRDSYPQYFGYVIKNAGTLTITDNSVVDDVPGKITGGSNIGNGGGVYNNGTFTMSGGIISDNYAVFDWENEDNEDNEFGYGGGVYNNGTFTMSGGMISDNYAVFDWENEDNEDNEFGYGGGVYNNGTFTMSGGIISDNYADYNGGGVYNYDTFTMTGGEIFGNDADKNGGGVYIDLNSTFNVSGTPVIKDNFTGGIKSEGSDVFSNGKNSNVYLSNGCYINISDGNAETPDDSLSVGAEIWVKLENPSYLITNISITNEDDDDNSAAFHSDNGYETINTGTGDKQVVQFVIIPVMSVDHGDGSTPYSDFEAGWNYAVIGFNNAKTVVKLLADWTADKGSFGTGDSFENGAILIPSGRSITLDLNGYTIDRGLSYVIQNGPVIFNYGTLTITDSSEPKSGKITGGYNRDEGGGVCNYGTLTMTGGEISGNGGGLWRRCL